jgi:surface-anchored protein
MNPSISLHPRLLLPLAGLSLTTLTFPLEGVNEWQDWRVVSAQHADVSTGYNGLTDEWSMWIDIGDDGQAGSVGDLLPPDHTIILIGATAKRTFSSNPPANFSFLGSAGDSYYRLLTTSEPGLPHLGFNGYGVDFDVFNGGFNGEFFVELTNFAGPGDFFLYLSGPTILMDSTQEGPSWGKKPELSGGHSHQNWVFKEPGIYLLEMTPHGFLAASGTKTTGKPTTFFFMVDPVPVDWWRLDAFRDKVKEPSAALLADASGDGRPNLLAYAFGFDPQAPAEGYLPATELVEADGQLRLSLVFRWPSGETGRADRSDLIYRPQASSDLLNWVTLDGIDSKPWKQIDPDLDGTPRFRVIDNEALTPSDRRFMRLVVEYKPRDQ